MKRNLLIITLTGLLALTGFACNMPGKVQSTPADLIRLLTSTAAAQTPKPSATPQTTTVTTIPTITIMPPVAPTPVNTYVAPTAIKPVNTVPVYVPPVPKATNTPIPIPCNLAAFVQDVSVPDGTFFKTGEAFTKTWRLKNIGSCNWSADYRIVLESGTSLGAPTSVNLPAVIAPGATVDISIPMTAPGVEGKFRGNWKLRSGNNETFSFANREPFYVQITTSMASALIYDFANNLCLANWKSNAGDLPCPGETDDNRGFVVKLDDPIMENGAHTSARSLETHPLWKANPAWDAAQDGGWIEGVYPPMGMQANYYFISGIGCLKDAATCDVQFMLDYRVQGEGWKSFTPAGDWHEIYDGNVRKIEVNLGALAGKQVEFKLKTTAASNEGQDWAVWVFPRIESR